MNPRNHFYKGMRLYWAGREYTVEGRLSSGEFQLRDSITGNFDAKSYRNLVDALFDGQLEFPADGTLGAKAIERSNRLLHGDFSALPERERSEAKRRFYYLEEARKRGIKSHRPEILLPFISEVARNNSDVNPPSPRTFSRWKKKYVASGNNPRSLVPAYENKGKHREETEDGRKVHRDVVRIISQVIDSDYLAKTRKSPVTIHELVAARIEMENMTRTSDKLLVPSLSKIYREVKKLDRYEVYEARYGKRIADLKYGEFKGGYVRPTRILQRVEMDHTKLDMFVVDPEKGLPIGRPWLTMAIDVYSRCIVGYFLSFEPPSSLSVMMCLKHAISPKSYVRKLYPHIVNDWDAHGLMETLVVDNGREFHSTHLEDAAYQLGIVLQYAPIRMAHYKGVVERHFGVLNKEFLHEQPGTTFSNVLDKGDYDPKKNAVVTMKALEECLHTWLIDGQHQKKHRGLNNIPSVVWRQSAELYPPALPPRAEELNILIGNIEERTISPSGILLHTLYYNDAQLAKLRREVGNNKVTIKFDPSDISVIHVLDPKTNLYFVVPAMDQNYARDLSLYQHNVIKANAEKLIKTQATPANLGLVRIKVEKIITRWWNEIVQGATRLKAARFLKIGREVQDAQTQISEEAELSKIEIPAYVSNGGKKTVVVCESARGISNVGATPADDEEDSTETDPSAESETVPTKEKETRTNPKSMQVGPEERTEAQGSEETIEESDEADDLDISGWDNDYTLPKKERK